MGNGSHGIGVEDQAQPTLEENVCANNEQSGIAYFFDNASGVARENEWLGNRWGVYVANTADPDLVYNDCHDNAEEDMRNLRR